MVNRFCLLLFVICSSIFLQAQDTLNVLDPVTVTATISPTAASKTGRNLVVLQGEQFKNLPVNSLDELLRYVPGIEVQARGPMGSQSDILIRGGTFQQVLVILDGVRLNDPLTGHFNSYIPITPSEIERVEVLKGASSAIYGAEAVGGVIHIITKTFARSGKKRSISGKIAAGEYGLLNGEIGGNYADDKNSFGVGLLTNHADGQPQRGTRGFFDLTTLSGSYARKLNDHWSLGIRSAYDSRSFSAQNYYTAFGSDTASEKVKTWWNQLQATYTKGNLRWNTTAGYKQVSDHYLYNNTSLPNDNKSDLAQFLSTLDLSFSPNTRLTTGVQYIQKGITSNDRGDHTNNQAAVFVILHQVIASRLYLDPALRLDYNQRGGTELVPQLNAAFDAGILQLRGSIGKTIRDADFTERFNNYNKALVTGGRIGNPDLEAERSSSYELGADITIARKLKVSASWFERRQQKLIDYVTTAYADMPRQVNLSPTGVYALAKNFSKVNTAGFETDVQFHQQFSNKQQLTANLGLLLLKSRLPGGGTPGLYISSHARFLTNFSLLYNYDCLTLSLNGVYKDRDAQEATAIHAQVSKNYLVVNGKADVKLFQHFGLFAQVDNIGNVSYSDLLGTPMPKRWLMGGLRCNW